MPGTGDRRGVYPACIQQKHGGPAVQSQRKEQRHYHYFCQCSYIRQKSFFFLNLPTTFFSSSHYEPVFYNTWKKILICPVSPDLINWPDTCALFNDMVCERTPLQEHSNDAVSA